ncbi:MAG: methionyl-tRNA formyltransferase [Candidatus Eisenbacteria bacterium]|nr:methionyl-tRNA formyltransferase [Candidatus Eisenbacteria bacterium]
MSRPRVVFMGTPEFAVPSLQAVAASCDVVAVVTQPDRPRGRGLAHESSAVARCAESLGCGVMKPADMKSDGVRGELAALAPDLFAVVAFGAILTPELLAVPRLGAINLHGSLLPEYRGASPVQRVLWDGRKTTGVTTLWMDHEIDTGDVILAREVPIAEDDDAGSLAARLAALGAPLLADSLQMAFEGRAPRVPQDRARGSYAGKMTKADGIVDWSLGAESVWHRQRAVTPWPGSSTTFRGRPVRLERTRVASAVGRAAEPGTVVAVAEPGVDVACGSGSLRIVKLKPEGRALLDAAAWARGVRLEDGERFESLRKAQA